MRLPERKQFMDYGREANTCYKQPDGGRRDWRVVDSETDRFNNVGKWVEDG